MLRKTAHLACALGILTAAVAAGCHKAAYYQRSIAFDQAETNGRTQAYFSVKENTKGLGVAFGGAGGGTVFAAGRYVAVRHKLEIIEPAATLPKSLDTVVTFCGSIQCEVLSSNISGTAADAIPSGSVAMRVTPQDLSKLLEFVAKQGKVSQHSTETEDKTAAVIDVEAKLKNQTEFRDSLRKMLVRPGVSVADLLQIQEKLAEAQAELDSEATQRKVLANETERSTSKSPSALSFTPLAAPSRPSAKPCANLAPSSPTASPLSSQPSPPSSPGSSSLCLEFGYSCDSYATSAASAQNGKLLPLRIPELACGGGIS